MAVSRSRFPRTQLSEGCPDVSTSCPAADGVGGNSGFAPLPAVNERRLSNVNCRIFPGETVDETQAALVATIADPGVKVTAEPPVDPSPYHHR
jgi:hypothetical protein